MAAGARSVRLGEAFVEVGVRDRVAGALKNIQGRLKSFGGQVRNIGLGISAVGSAITAPLLLSAKLFADVGSKIHDTAKKTGASTEFLSVLAYGAKLSSSEFEAAAGSISKMQKQIVEASEGNESAAETFQDLGLSAAKLRNMSTDEQFTAIAEAMSKVDDDAKKSALAMGVFGKSGGDLIPMLEGGAAGLEEFRKAAEKSGNLLNDQQAADADALGDAIDGLSLSFEGMKMQVGAALAGTLTKVFDYITSLVQPITEWIKNNKEIVVAVGAVGAALMVLGSTLAVTGIAISGIGTVVGLLLSPFALVVAAIAGAVAAFIQFTDAGQKMAEGFKQAWGGISDAIAAGRLDLAVKIVWLKIKGLFDEGTGFIHKVWLDIVGAMENRFFEFFKMIRLKWRQLQGMTTNLLLKVGGAIGVVDDPEGAIREANKDTNRDLNRIQSQTKEQRLKELADKKKEIDDRTAYNDLQLKQAIAEATQAKELAMLERQQWQDDKDSQKNKAVDFQAKVKKAGSTVGTFFASQASLFSPGAGKDVPKQQLDVQKKALTVQEKMLARHDKIIDLLSTKRSGLVFTE